MVSGRQSCARVAAAGLLAAALAGGGAAQSFTDQWASSGFSDSEATQGVMLGDVDGDGDVDVFTTSLFVDNPIPFLPDLGGPDRLYLNTGSGSFTDAGAAWRCDDRGAGQGGAFADYDNDGALDLYVVRGLQAAVPQGHLLYHQLGGRFDSAPSAYVSAARAGRSACWADYDNDGRLDVFVTNGLDSGALLPDSRTFLFHQEPDATFTDRTVYTGLDDRRNGYACAWSDYDNDGDMDLYLANHGFEDPVLGLSDPQANALYQNQLAQTGVATFVDVAAAAGVEAVDLLGGISAGGASQACAFADFDNDGWMDLFVADGFSGIVPFPTPNRLYHNERDGTFSDRSLAVIDADFDESSVGITWGDFDNDGDLDVFVANAEVPLVATATDDLLVNSGWPLWVLTNREASAGVDVHAWAGACASADLNGDGFLDIYVANGVPGAELLFEAPDNLFVGTPNGNHWLHLDLVGRWSNRSAVGARVTLTTWRGSQTREVSAGSGFQSMDDLRVEFGLGSVRSADTITIRWPSGCMQELRDVAADQVIEVVEPCDPPPYILRGPLGFPPAGSFPLPEYARATADTPWRDPEPVLGDGRTLLYEHPGVAEIRVRKAGATVELSW